MKNNILAIVLLIFCMGRVDAQSFELDNTFDGDGNVTLTFPQNNSYATVLLVQPDGKIIVGGDEGKQTYYIAIARLNPDGSLDNSFGNNGKISGMSNALLMEPSKIRTMALQGENLLVAGYFSKYPIPTYNHAVVRFTKNGQPDPTFGVSGKLEIVYDYLADPIDIQAMAVRPDGKIIIVGRGNGVYKVLQYDRNGKRDGTFTIGKIPVDQNTSADCSIALGADGKLLVAIGIGSDLILSRFLPNGQLDKTFGTDGTTKKTLITYLPDSFINLAKLMLDPLSGEITVAVTDYGRYPTGLFLVRYDKNGILNQSFGVNGVVKHLKTFITEALLNPDGKMLTVARTKMTRYNKDGSLDNSFGTNGYINVLFGDTLVNNNSRGAYGLSIQPNGDIVVCGMINDQSAVARYHLGLFTGLPFDEDPFRKNIALSPNPIKENALLEYSLDATERVTIQLLDLQGRLLEVFVSNEKQEEGAHQLFIQWPEYLSPGMYCLSVVSPSKRACIKVVKN